MAFKPYTFQQLSQGQVATPSENEGEEEGGTKEDGLGKKGDKEGRG